MGLSAALLLSSQLCQPQLSPELGDNLWSLQGERESSCVSLPWLRSLLAPFLDEVNIGINGRGLWSTLKPSLLLFALGSATSKLWSLRASNAYMIKGNDLERPPSPHLVATGLEDPVP